MSKEISTDPMAIQFCEQAFALRQKTDCYEQTFRQALAMGDVFPEPDIPLARMFKYRVQRMMDIPVILSQPFESLNPREEWR